MPTKWLHLGRLDKHRPHVSYSMFELSNCSERRQHAINTIDGPSLFAMLNVTSSNNDGVSALTPRTSSPHLPHPPPDSMLNYQATPWRCNMELRYSRTPEADCSRLPNRTRSPSVKVKGSAKSILQQGELQRMTTSVAAWDRSLALLPSFKVHHVAGAPGFL